MAGLRGNYARSHPKRARDTGHSTETEFGSELKGHPQPHDAQLEEPAMSTNMAQAHIRHISAPSFGGVRLLDAIELSDGRCIAIFPKTLTIPQAETALGLDSGDATSLNGGAYARLDATPVGLSPSTPENDILAGRNVAIATRNGEPIETVLEWIKYHHIHFKLSGAVIFDRSAPESSELANLKLAIDALKIPFRAILVRSPIPLGDPTKPAEAHPWCVREAPGHDRMEVPPSDPWVSPLFETAIYEIARHRWLGKSLAAANIDICDLLFEAPGKLLNKRAFQTPFDMAAAHPGQVVLLEGQHCYPWRVRESQPPSYADHICTQFDNPKFRQRWCVALPQLREKSLLLTRRIPKTQVCGEASFFRYMAIRHPSDRASLIVPKTSLVENKLLLQTAKRLHQFKPVRLPRIKAEAASQKDMRTAIVTTMKNEGPFILEWLAYHQAIGVQNFLVYTNDCDDGTDTMFDLLQSKGILQHRENPFREVGLKPQHAALQAAEDEPMLTNADWAICMDVDEFLNVKVGDGTLAALYDAVGDANMISCTWRLFGNSDLHLFEDIHTIGQFDRCAFEFSPKPHQAWGFKTLFRNIGIFKKMGVHRPKGLRPQLWEEINWVNGSGNPLPKEEFRNAWRSTTETYGYDLVSLNHYAVRNAESFLVKRDRGRVNHVDRDQGLAYWFRMNNNATEDRSIMTRIPMMEEKLAAFMADPEIAAQHHACVAAHRAKIDELRERPDQQVFYGQLTSPRMERLSRMHGFFGSNVFLAGPESVPDDVIWGDHAEDFYFTVDTVDETQH